MSCSARGSPHRIAIVDATQRRCAGAKRSCQGSGRRAPVRPPGQEGTWPTGRNRCESQLEAWLNMVDRYLTWIEILGEKTDGGDRRPWIRMRCPAFRRGPASCAFPSGSRRGQSRLDRSPSSESGSTRPRTDLPIASWIDRVLKAFDKSKWLAGEMLASSRATRPGRTRALRIDEHALPL